MEGKKKDMVNRSIRVRYASEIEPSCLRKMNESIQKLREGLYEYARQENEFRETVDAIEVVKDEINKR